MSPNLSIDIQNISKEEKKSREESLKLFEKSGFPNKKLEEWKFTDLDKIINKNFNELTSIINSKNIISNFNFLKDFEHNYITTYYESRSSCSFNPL